MRNKMLFGDTLIVHDLSRFGRDKQEIKNEWESLINENIDVVVLSMPILDTRKYKELEGVGQLVSDTVHSFLSWMVDEERERIRVAQREGVAIAKKQGKYIGRKPKYDKHAIGKDKLIYDEIISSVQLKTSVMDIHRKTGVSRITIYNIKRGIDENVQAKHEL